MAERKSLDRLRNILGVCMICGAKKGKAHQPPCKGSLTTDRSDPGLKQLRPDGQQEVYLVMDEHDMAKGFVRPVRHTYVHAFMLDGSDVPAVQTTREGMGGCGATTSMGAAIAETYARDPKFYGQTYCSGCKTHLLVEEFHWDYDQTTRTYQRVGS